MMNFDWEYSIKLISITSGGTNQSTGGYGAPAGVETDIKAHVVDLTIKELQILPEGIYAIGDRRLITDKSHGVKPKDRIKITEADATVTEWDVVEREKSFGIIKKFAGESRVSFLLKKKA